MNVFNETESGCEDITVNLWTRLLDVVLSARLNTFLENAHFLVLIYEHVQCPYLPRLSFYHHNHICWNTERMPSGICGYDTAFD